MSSTTCSVAVEDVFGPVVAPACLDGFDFTLLFEETILTILPIGVTFLLALLRLRSLRNENVKFKNSYHVPGKLLAYLAYIALQIVLLTLWNQPHVAKTRATIATVAMSLVAFILFMWVSYWEHRRSLRPSTLLTVYLGLSTLLDLARTRTLFFFAAGHQIASVSLASYCVKVLIFGLEVAEKRRLMLDNPANIGPEDTANVYRRALFLWLNRLFVESYRSLLSIESLPNIDQEILSASDPGSLRLRWEKSDKSNEHALLWTFLVHYKWTILAATLPRLAETGFTFAQPFMIDRVLSYTSSPRENRERNVAYGLIGAYAIVYIGNAISVALYEHKIYRTLAKFRGSLVSLVYEKTLRLGHSGSWNAEAITFMSADIDRLGIAMQDVHELYAGTLEVALCLWLLYVYLGVAAAAVAAFSVFCLASSVPIATAAGKAQVPWLEAIETRLTSTARTLGNFRLIRMAGLTERVCSVLKSLREEEIKAARRYRVLNVLISVGYYLSYAFSPVWGFGTYILVARAHNSATLDEGTAFGAQAIFSLLNKPTVLVIDAIEHLQTITECFSRMQEYLLREELEKCGRLTVSEICEDNSSEKTIQLHPLESPTRDHLSVAVLMRGLTIRYSSDQKPVLQDINIEIPDSKITMIVGPVGSGKSTILKLLLGEIPPPENQVMINFCKAAYCAQQPWVFKASIRENIVGMSPWDEAWYKEVLQACDLSRDFNAFPNKDQTEVDMRGDSLSGGQKARMSLARALFSKEPVLLLDDVLTGLDPVTEQTVLSAVFGPTGLAKRLRSTVIMTTSSAGHLQHADKILLLEKGGRVTLKSPSEDLCSIAQDLHSYDDTEKPKSQKQETFDLDLADLGVPTDEDVAAATSRQKGDLKAYTFYAQIAGWKTFSLWLIFSAIFMFGLNFPTVWLQWWVNANENDPNGRVGYWLGIFATFSCIAIVANIISDCMVQLVIVPKTSAGFHELLLSTTARATTSFFSTTHSGSILNRFSQDLELIDSDLPGSLDKTLFSILQTIFTTVLVFVGSGYLSITLPACLLIVYGIQHFYLRTSRQLRHVDIEAKEPLFSHFLDTVRAIDSIRAYGWEDAYKRRSREALDTSQAPYYLMWSIQRWLTLTLNLFVAGLAILLVALATNIQGGSTAYLGVALSNIVNFGTTLQLLVTDWTQLETAICAVNRIRGYVSDTQTEQDDETCTQAPLNWPSAGSVVFENVSASYPSVSRQILRNIDLSILPGEKVAICGRTGSGKSTLVNTLLRMVDIGEGKIKIDGIDIQSLLREDVRRRLTIMPQETFFVSGTIRQNLDPLQLSDDNFLTNMLEDLGLAEIIRHSGGLDAELNEDTLSSGQQQLICLARAMVKSGPILLLDEATSSVDSATSTLMQEALRKAFDKKTVIAIAHRLETIIDFDRVIILEEGAIIESGNPKNLLTKPGSEFKRLSETMGEAANKQSSSTA